MKIAFYVKKRSLQGDRRVESLLSRLRDGGLELYDICAAGGLLEATDLILSFGGDGTFLTAARVAAPAGVSMIGVNMGRLGFLSANTPDEVAEALLSGSYTVEERDLLEVRTDAPGLSDWTPYALNEMCVHRAGASMLGVDVSVDGAVLPTYWADGLLVSTSSGSTAYSLSVGGPICMPDASVLIIAPIASHNLNVRPLVVPASSSVSIKLRSREAGAVLSLDNRNHAIPATATIEVGAAPVRLKVLNLGKSNFINALRSRLLWGEDVRNAREQNN